MARRRLRGIVARRHGDHRQATTAGLERHFDRRGVQPAVRVDEHHVARRERIARKKDRRVAFGALQPEQLTRSARPDGVEPHQARVQERTETDEAPIAGEDVEDGDDRVSAAVDVHRTATTDRVGHQFRRAPDVGRLLSADALDHLLRAIEIALGRQITSLLVLTGSTWSWGHELEHHLVAVTAHCGLDELECTVGPIARDALDGKGG